MISMVHVWLQKIKQTFNSDEWLIRLLHLSKEKNRESRPGLVMIQLDGLSYRLFEKAAEEGYLPFLKTLHKKEHYGLWPHYSGVPSSTPAIQGELFYGVKQCIPAFKYRDHASREIFTFYDSGAAVQVEERMRQMNKGLLAGGSSYSNIFSGGAKETHYCVASINWNYFFKVLKPYTVIVVVLLNLWNILRMAFYAVIELIVGIYDFILGFFRGYGFKEEFRFILTRLMVTVVLREVITTRVKIDIARGLPIIHVNFFGYDEQAHRRGPSSRFAFWALPGIDRCIQRIWKAAQDSLRRDYDVWIYSDHGQEEVVPFAAEMGIRMEVAVERVFRKRSPNEEFETRYKADFNHEGIGCRSEKWGAAKKVREKSSQSEARELVITAQGPLGYIYPPRDLRDDEIEDIAAALISEAQIPLVVATDKDGHVCGWTRDGKFRLLEQGDSILGEYHPHRGEVSRDLVELYRHQDSGVFLISGWRKTGKSVSFPAEMGSHGGPGDQETQGFALLSPDIRNQLRGKKYLRPMDLREAALDILQHPEKFIYYGAEDWRPRENSLRVMTYNVHRCLGMDGKISVERIARVIARHRPTAIALQELDVGRSRTGGVDQAAAIAKLLDLEFHFHPVLRLEDELYGDAILSCFPMELVRAEALPALHKASLFEPRGALWVEMNVHGQKVQVVNTHLSLWPNERKKQAAALKGEFWLSHPRCRGHVILCGDFNATPRSGICRNFGKILEDVEIIKEKTKPLKTWFGHYPLNRIDHIFTSSNIEVTHVEVPSSRLEKIASDHLPFIADLKLSTKEFSESEEMVKKL